MFDSRKIGSIAIASMLLLGMGAVSPSYSLVSPMQAMAASSARPSMNVPYTVPNYHFVAWQNTAIPSTAFLSQATSAEITVKGAVYVAFSRQRDQWNYIDIDGGTFNWSNSNTAGVTFVATGDVLDLAKQGLLFVRTNASDGLELIVKNVGAADGGNVEGGTSEPEQPAEPEEVTEYSTNLWEWSDIPVTGTAFGEHCTSAKLNVVNACYVRYSHKINGQLQTIREFSWSDSNRKGVNLELTGDLLAEAKQGNLYIYVGGANGSTIKLTITSEGAAEVEPNQPEEPETPVEPDQPEEPETPVEPDQPEEPETPVEPEQPEESETPVEPDQPEEPQAPVEPEQPEEPETPVEPDQPEEPETPVEPDQPEEPETPVEPEQPEEPETPVEPEQPTEPDQPAEPETPTDVYGVVQRSTRTLSEWQDIQLGTLLFNANADKAKVSVSGACYVKFTHRINGNLVTLTNGEYSWNDQNKGGVHYELTGSLLDEAKRGNIYVWVGGGSPINLLVTSYGQGGTPEDEAGELPEGIDSNDMFDPTARAYAIAKRAQLTTNPTFYFTIPDAEGKDINTVLFKDRSTNTAEYHTATLQVVDKNDGGLTEFTSELEMKVRGNSTADMVKRPYRLKLPKGSKQDLLGLGYSKRNWTLLANYVDPSLVRNALTYHIGKMVGMEFCPGYKFVDVVMNNEYRGLYQVSDHVEVGKNRINVNEDTGWYVEISRGDMVEEPCVFAGGLPMSIKNPEPSTDAETQALKQEVSAWFTAAQTMFFSTDRATFLDPERGWRSMFDEESMVNYYVAVNMTGDYDGFMTVKLYRETAKNGKMKVGPLWDKDLAFGNFTADNGTTLVEDMHNGQFGYYVQKLTTDPVFMQNVRNKVQSLKNQNVESKIQDYIDQMVETIGISEELNQVRWPGHSSWIYSFGTYGDAVQQLRNYETSHLQYFFGEVEKMYTAARSAAPGRDEATAIGTLTAQTRALHVAAERGQLTLTAATDQQVVVRNLSGAVVATLSLEAGVRQSVDLPAGVYIVNGTKAVVK